MVFPQSLEAVKERFFVNAFFVILLDEEKGSLRLTRGGGRQFSYLSCQLREGREA